MSVKNSLVKVFQVKNQSVWAIGFRDKNMGEIYSPSSWLGLTITPRSNSLVTSHETTCCSKFLWLSREYLVGSAVNSLMAMGDKINNLWISCKLFPDLQTISSVTRDKGRFIARSFNRGIRCCRSVDIILQLWILSCNMAATVNRKMQTRGFLPAINLDQTTNLIKYKIEHVPNKYVL